MSVSSAHIKLFIVAVLWGLTWPAARLVALHLPAVTSAAWRFTAASALMLLIIRWRRGGWPHFSLRLWLWMAASGVVGVFGYALCFMWALTMVPAGRGSLVIVLNPVCTALAAALFFRERLTPGILLGMVVASLGACVVITHGHIGKLFAGELGRGELILLGCVLCWVLYSLMAKVTMREVDSYTATAYPTVFGTLCLLAVGPWFDAHIIGQTPAAMHYADAPIGVWLSLIFLVVGATVLAYAWFFEGVSQLGATLASAYITLVPVFGVLFAWLLLGEASDWSLAVGGVLAVGGIVLMNGVSLITYWKSKTAG